MNNPIESHGNELEQDDPTTLDPPGSIAVIGAGPIGIEAALYGRYLGYDVTLLEAVSVGSSMANQRASPLPMLPDRCLTTLALSALRAQSQAAGTVATEPQHSSLPITVGQWIDDALLPLTQTDLLRNRLRVPARVTRIEMVPVEPDHVEEDTSDIPADFQITYLAGQAGQQTLQCEAVILAVGAATVLPTVVSESEIELGFPIPAPYFFRAGGDRSGDPERDLRNGWREIVSIYAGLAGRGDLDLYRPKRS